MPIKKGPANSTTERGGARSYKWKDETFVSVTTAISAIDKPALRSWVGKMVAEYAIENLEQINAIAGKDPEGAIELLKGAPWRKRDRAANLGSSVHAEIEAMILGQPRPERPEPIAPFMAQFDRFVVDFSPQFEMSEATVYSREFGYAGTLDSIAVIPTLGRQLLDVKTGSGVYGEAALQMAAYSRGEFIGLPDGSEAAVPAVNGAAVLHLRPEDYELIPVRIDAEIYATFLAALDLYRAKQNDRTWIGKPIAPEGALA